LEINEAKREGLKELLASLERLPPSDVSQSLPVPSKEK
jgi:hypothetical protein